MHRPAIRWPCSLLPALCAESAVFAKKVAADLALTLPTPMNTSEAVAKAIVDAATTKEAALIITFTYTGSSV